MNAIYESDDGGGFWCFRCKQVVPLVHIGDWYPPWALCPDCAETVEDA